MIPTKFNKGDRVILIKKNNLLGTVLYIEQSSNNSIKYIVTVDDFSLNLTESEENLEKVTE